MSNRSVRVFHNNFFINKLKRTKKFDMPQHHFHEDYEIFYLIQGERKYFINDTIYKISEGNLVLVNVNEIHKTSDFSDHSHERIVVNFTPAFLAEFSQNVNALNLYSCFNLENRVLPLSFKYKNNIEGVLNRLLEVDKSQSDNKNFHSKVLLCELLILINNFVDDFKLKGYSSMQPINPKVSQVIKYINENYHQAISLSSVAKEFYLSPFYLSKLFKQTTNFTFIEYLNSVKIRNATQLLQDKKYKIIDIAEKVGFTNNTHFTRVFKTVMGMSPMKYRKLLSER
ncbi:AraC family transcriptional regulator [Clostridium beijerinckii]|uniref:Melibiose operon regulatory protein n=1 Tax=Clostridium beijerinckii TaxID=1520 RepID=A0A1S8SAD5_CLOBE|nr:AraC family transcriptional regulator [Clostridium beijerinckii]NRY59488.1 AraC-like DNA-binding protein [Clostridium beijerinckii]OOM62357.1 melibiose operon regulatory protein [Clostridium beijerinckii]